MFNQIIDDYSFRNIKFSSFSFRVLLQGKFRIYWIVLFEIFFRLRIYICSSIIIFSKTKFNFWIILEYFNIKPWILIHPHIFFFLSYGEKSLLDISIIYLTNYLLEFHQIIPTILSLFRSIWNGIHYFRNL